ncbi:hypothetical protein [Skermania sp. ID1734]|uniref:hypothetical protein n=1 Tax=Skermania sp. ID1734 TaxID=2597516 RepID=UPI001C8F44C2|nr:hypothetical protein [Skermania sp. ID1734]
MTPNHRAEIRAAMDRLLAGTPLRSDGALTIVSLAAEADIKRHLLTHRHTDLKDEFYARVRAQHHIPASEQQLRTELQALKTKLARVNRSNAELRETIEAFARIINVLTTENTQLTHRLHQDTHSVTPLRRGDASRV